MKRRRKLTPANLVAVIPVRDANGKAIGTLFHGHRGVRAVIESGREVGVFLTQHEGRVALAEAARLEAMR